MNVILFGASGMIGQGVLRECLESSEVTRVLTVGRTKLGQTHEKLEELVHEDFADFSSVADKLTGFDACFFCLGVSSAGLTEAAYTRVTYEFTMAAATVLAERNRSMRFVFVSGQGTDATERGRTMWARVKGRTENALQALGFSQAVMFRPGFIEPMHGATSKTRSYRILYRVLGPIIPLLRVLAPNAVTSTERIGKAMLRVAKEGAPKTILETADINALGA